VEKNKIIRNQKGFTLLEIIAVLVIIGILAAVAVPKYMSLTEESRIKAARGAINEVIGRCNQAYGNCMLKNNGDATLCTAAKIIDYDNIGTAPPGFPGFTVKAEAGTNKITVTVSAVNGVTIDPSQTGDWEEPHYVAPTS
jgi:MSHA pilin protein MshA